MPSFIYLQKKCHSHPILEENNFVILINIHRRNIEKNIKIQENKLRYLECYIHYTHFSSKKLPGVQHACRIYLFCRSHSLQRSLRYFSIRTAIGKTLKDMYS